MSDFINYFIICTVESTRILTDFIKIATGINIPIIISLFISDTLQSQTGPNHIFTAV